MSEVKRYHVTDAGLVEGQALGRINVVLGPDYDSAVQCFLTAAEGCVAAERRERALQALLTAADERLDAAVNLLEVWRTWLGPTRESCDETGKKVWDRIDAVTALKPAEGGGDEQG